MSLHFNLQLARRDFMLDLKGDFPKGITGIFGPSGAGKSSLFALLAGLEKPQSGYISLNERILTDCSRHIHIPVHKRRVGVVFQDMRLFPHLTVKENLTFSRPYSSFQERKIPYQRVVDILNLGPLQKSYPHEISGGEQRRTALGRSLLASVELLLLDEPFNGLDRELKESLIPCLKELGDARDTPILLISHEMEDILALTENIYPVFRGQESCLHRHIPQDNPASLLKPQRPSFPYNAP